jgi:AcrR family transcriptional regulator
MTRDDILDAAAQVFRQKGYHGASMQDVASAVNLQKASLYHHVASKQDILLALLDRALALLSEHIAGISNGVLLPEEKLRAMICAYLGDISTNSDLASVLLFEHRSLDKKAHARHVPQRDKFEALWRNVLDEGVREGTFQFTDTGLAVRALMGVMNWTVTWYQPGGRQSIEEIADAYTDLLLHGLLK